MFCQKCGTQNLDDVNFCSKCGNNLKSIKEPSITGLLKWNNILLSLISLAILTFLTGGLILIPVAIILLLAGIGWIILGIVWVVRTWKKRKNIQVAWERYSLAEQSKPYFKRYIIRDVYKVLKEALKSPQ